MAASGSGIERLVATPPAAASTGDHTYAQHAKELNDGKAQNDQHSVTQYTLQELIQLGLTTLWVKLVRLIQTASALCGVFTAGLRHCAVVAGIPGGVGPAGGVSDTTALELFLQEIHSCGVRRFFPTIL